MKAVFWLGITLTTKVSCACFKQSKIALPILHIHILGCFVKFLVIWGDIRG